MGRPAAASPVGLQWATRVRQTRTLLPEQRPRSRPRHRLSPAPAVTGLLGLVRGGVVAGAHPRRAVRARQQADHQHRRDLDTTAMLAPRSVRSGRRHALRALWQGHVREHRQEQALLPLRGDPARLRHPFGPRSPADLNGARKNESSPRSTPGSIASPTPSTLRPQLEPFWPRIDRRKRNPSRWPRRGGAASASSLSSTACWQRSEPAWTPCSPPTRRARSRHTSSPLTRGRRSRHQ